MLSASSRLLRVLSLLVTRRHWSGAALAERLEVHPRTLRRDIDRLRQLGYPIRASSGVEGGYSFRPGKELPPLLLEDDEALAAAIALRTATAGTVKGIEESALRALVKLEQVMPARLQRRVDALRSAIEPIVRTGPAVDADALATIAAACRDQLKIAFMYVDRNGTATSRTVEPQGVVHTGHRWYLVAWDPLRDDWRTFRIDRIEGTLVVGSHFSPVRHPRVATCVHSSRARCRWVPIQSRRASFCTRLMPSCANAFRLLPVRSMRWMNIAACFAAAHTIWISWSIGSSLSMWTSRSCNRTVCRSACALLRRG